MARTTLNIDPPVLEGLRRLQEAEGKSLGQLASELLADAIAARCSGSAPATPPLDWFSKNMGARVDLTDKDAVFAILDREGG